MSKTRLPVGFYKRTVHDGSRSYSVILPNPDDGYGEHTKTEKQRERRHWFYHMAHITPTQSHTILRIYRGEY